MIRSISRNAVLALGLAQAMSLFANTAAFAQSAGNFGVMEFDYIRPDGARITEIRNINLELYISSGGTSFDPVQSAQQSECDPPVLPTIPVFPSPAPPPSSQSLPPSTSTVVIYQEPVGGVPGWYQRVKYVRPTYPRPDGTWDPPGPWGNPQVNQIRGAIPDARCSFVSQ